MLHRRPHAAACSRPGPGSRWPGRWRAATRARSGGRSTRRGSGSRCASCSSLPFLRPPLRLLHLDLAVLLAFSVSYALLRRRGARRLGPGRVSAARLPARAHAGVAVARGRALRPAGPADRPPLRLAVPAGFLVLGVVFLVGFRIALNVADGNVIDVGYAGVIGADRIASRRRALRRLPRRQRARRHLRPGRLRRVRPVRARCCRGAGAGTTCPPPTRPRWPSTSAARCCCGCSAGASAARRWGSCWRTSGSTYPFTLLVANSNANDALVAAARAGRDARGGAPGRARGDGRARRADQVRAARARAAVRHLPRARAGRGRWRGAGSRRPR